jgi:hypothetical protein
MAEHEGVQPAQAPAAPVVAVPGPAVGAAPALEREAFHAELYATVKPQIASLYLKKWRENLGWATKTFTNEEEGGERRIRTRAGMPDTGQLPEPKLQ